MSDTATTASIKQQSLDLKTILEDLFLVLTSKEKDIIVKRFSLNNEPRQTLEKIGQHFNVTRERIRQIESIALNKLRRTVSNSKLRVINKLVCDILEKDGGVMLEQDIMNNVLKQIGRSSSLDGSIVRLALNINSRLAKVDRSRRFDSFWRFKEVSFADIKKVINASHKILKKHGVILSESQLVQEVIDLKLFDNKKPTDQFILACVRVDKEVKETENGWGISEWRTVNPRSIKDKSLIALRKKKEKMHFVEIANAILDIGFDKKSVTVQAVHNELIRSPEFVLVGRGIYALKEWGFNHGTVADVIRTILKEKGPLHRQEIIQEVWKQREVKEGTISLNLQKEPDFVRVGRAVYDYNSDSKK